ncbi:MAG: KilA-N domain-containing protein [Methylococcaceae bacterium]|nr:MAG: KilA-N domain-containing protein [Methylococcaceae bacterium]
MSAANPIPKTGNVIHLDYQGAAIGFTGDGWFNATEAAARFGKRPVDWLKLDSTKEYLSALSEQFGEVRKFHFTKRGSNKGGQGGGGETWMHPKLAVAFARWLDVRFVVWCDAQIDGLILGKPRDWLHDERHRQCQ